jgi:iron complex outermembrane receptor protein
LSITAGGAYLDAKYAKFPNALVYSPTGFGNTQSSEDVSGNQLMRTPKWTLNGSISYSHAIDAGELHFYAGANYNSGIYFDPGNRIHQPKYALVDAEISFSPTALPGAKVSVWGKNLTNHDYLQSVLESQIGDAGSYSDPRTYGVRLEYQF